MNRIQKKLNKIFGLGYKIIDDVVPQPFRRAAKIILAGSFCIFPFIPLGFIAYVLYVTFS